MERTDVLIVGSGIAGLSVALGIHNREVLIVSPGRPGEDGSSVLAQGGMAAALGADDDPLQHARDTMTAAAGLANGRAVDRLTRSAPEAVRWLASLGVTFDRRDGRLVLGREAAHGRSRIVHAGGDATGRTVMDVLWRQCRTRGHLRVWSGARVVSLISERRRVVGAWIERRGRIEPVAAREVVLACGGVGGLYRRTTNPEWVSGWGLALAAGCGATLADLEFVQFHPTALDVDATGTRLPLATEALRGAGAVLLDGGGRRFMPARHPDAELAPRDVVALAIHQARARTGRVLLDATVAVGPAFPERFPTVFEHCRKHAIDPRIEPIPVTPAAHYHMGGVAVDASGHTDVAGLWACGEVARSGVHGGNRLASNSLVEGVVFGRRLGRVLSRLPRTALAGVEGEPPASPAPRGVAESLRQLMWDQVGIERHADGLEDALNRIRDWRGESCAVEESAMLVAAEAIARAALARRHSIGAHHRLDAQEWQQA